MKNSIIIGIAGGSASGKTSISRQVYEFFKGSHTTCIIKQDDYYKDQSHLSFEERVKTNYDHPFAFDNDLLVEQLKQLKEGKSISKPTYDYTQHTRSDVVETITPRDVYILEGLFVLYDEKMRAQALLAQQLESRLDQALQENEFVVYYQPKVSMKDGSIIGSEALIRWNHPDKGFLMPGVFISLSLRKTVWLKKLTCGCLKKFVKQWGAKTTFLESKP